MTGPAFLIPSPEKRMMKPMPTQEKKLIFGGMARLPKEFTDAEVFQVIAAVDPSTGKVSDVEILPDSPMILKLLKPMMVGMSLPGDLPDVLQKIELQLFHRYKKAVLVAVKDMVREFRESQMPKPVHPVSISDPFNR